MNAADIMSRPVLAVDPETSVAQAIRLMTENKVSGLPVVSREGRVVGILTEGDLLRRVETGTTGEPAGWLASFLMPGRQAERYVRTHGRRVGEVMTAGAITVAENAPLPELVELMQRHHVKRLPVVRDGKLLGVVSRADLVRRVGEALAAEPSSASDEAIQKAIVDQMARESWTAPQGISIEVKDGMVALDGCLFDLRERDALGVLAENVPGVKGVENRIVCIEPVTGTITYDPLAPSPPMAF